VNGNGARLAISERLPVDAAAIERELASMWKNAGAEQQSGLVTRACTWNVIAHLEHRAQREGAAGASDLAAVLGSLPERVATRTLLLRTEPEAGGASELETWISANCALGAGGRYVCSEEITIAARGSGDRHLPSLVRALAVPDIPTAAVFAGLPDTSDPVLVDLLGSADRIITDADRSGLSRPVAILRSLAARRGATAMDLGWLGTVAARRKIADLADDAGVSAAEIRAIHVTGAAASAVSRRLLVGWCAAKLSALEVEASGPQRVTARLPRQAQVELCFEDGPPSITMVTSRGERTATLELDPASDMGRLARALEGSAENLAYQRSLHLAPELNKP
jgi:glucose-6-phosphate dehydrogenase assembly protein OpcA